MRVVLVHGLGRTPLSMLVLARRLRGWGLEPRLFGYLAALQPFDAIVGRLARRLEQAAVEGPWGAVGHSLGGVLLRAAVARVSLPAPRHLVLLGTPARPPRLARKLSHLGLFGLLFGDPGRGLAREELFRALPPPTYPVTVVAGTRGPRGKGSPFGDEPNDGIVAVAETRLGPGVPVVELPLLHTFLMNARSAQEVVRRALVEADG